MKSYTDIEQSRKLTKILSIETADMYHFIHGDNHSDTIGMGYDKTAAEFYSKTQLEYIPCWSLTALLGVLPFHIISKNERYGFDMGKGLNRNGETYMIRYNIFSTNICLCKTEYYNNPVDAACEMILKLHELNLL